MRTETKASTTERATAKILIVEDEPNMVAGLRDNFEFEGYTVVTARDGVEGLQRALDESPDLVVLDVGMPLLNGFDAARQLREKFPKLKLVFLTMHEDPNLAAAAMAMGSVGFLVKHSAASELGKAIEHVLQGFTYLTPRLKLDGWMMKERVRGFFHQLSARQREVVQLFGEGHSIKEIAWQLHLSEKTVEFHKRQIMQAHNLKSNADLVLFALDQGLIVHNTKPRSGLALPRPSQH